MSELRPSTLGEILDRTVNLYRSRFLVFFGIACVPASVMLGFGGLAVLLFAWQGAAGPAVAVAVVAGMVLFGLAGLPVMIGANALSGAALCHAASAQAMGQTVSIRSAFGAAWPRGWQYVGLYLLLALIILAAPFAAWVVLVTMFAAVAAMAGTGSSFASGALIVIVCLGLAVYAIWMLLQLCLAFPVSVIEEAGAGGALRRAWDLSRGTRSRMLVLFVLGMSAGWIVSLMLLIPMTVVMALVPALNSPEHARMTATASMIGIYGASFLVQSLTWPLYAIALVLFYYDQRVRREGFDIELLMQRAGMGPESTGTRAEAVLAAESPAAPDSASAPASAEAAGREMESTRIAPNGEQGTAGGVA